jgi:hypothetical protein
LHGIREFWHKILDNEHSNYTVETDMKEDGENGSDSDSESTSCDTMTEEELGTESDESLL